MGELENPPNLTNVEIVTYALAELGGGATPVHLERIADRASTYSPGAFRWDLDEYRERIDKDKVRVSLTDAQKEKYGELVRAVGAKRAGIAKPTDAWQLTPSGTAWYLANSGRIAETLGHGRPALKKGRADDLRRRLVASTLFEQYRDHGRVKVDPFSFADLLECSPDASNEVVQKKLDTLMNQVQLLREPDLVEFLEACAAQHQDMLVHRGAQA